MSQVTDYSAVVAAVLAAVTSQQGTDGKWQKVAATVPAFFGSAEALLEVKAQFIADAILPAIPKHAKALTVELPRKNSVEYKALDAAGVAAWEAADKAKIHARATADKMFKRIVSYAFPKEKTDPVTKSLETKLAELINDAIGKIEKAEAPAFDAVTALTGLRAALAAIAK